VRLPEHALPRENRLGQSGHPHRWRSFLSEHSDQRFARARPDCAATSPREANAPADEREKIIGDRAGNRSGYVIVVPALGALWHYAANGDSNILVHLVFLSLMPGQIATFVFQIICYRRGV